jgi:hypothetical protein
MTAPRSPPSPGSERPGSSWPLLLVAGAAFIPIFGLFLGAVAVSWGLLSQRPRARLAVGLGFAGALANLVAFLVVAWSTHDSPVMRRARQETTVADLTKVVLALEDYHREQSRYPVSLQALVGEPVPTRLINIRDLTSGLFQTRLYQYHPASDGQSYDLFSAGLDGRLGTPDDLRPALSDSLIRATGYRPAPPTPDPG